MPFHWTSVWLATAGALVLGLLLAYALAVHDVRAIAFVLVPLLAVPPVVLAALRWKAALPAAGVASGLPFVALITARRFRDIDRQYGNAARSHGASEWRLFWRLLLPLAWKTVGLGTALAFARIAAESAIAA
ncbi:MAG TPA: ABC transporter permease subunit, partial [Candidatus Sulfopaludibacter sp.]|nr:ABC transporter permease subunit [Candidatus Sulfopaludibacter sp.]